MKKFIFSFCFIVVTFASISVSAVTESLLVSHESKHVSDAEKQARRAEAQARKELKIYKKVKDKAWDDLSSKEKNFAKKHGITSAELYDSWKAKQADALALQEGKKQLKIYEKYKLAGKAWDDLSRKQQAFAKKQGISDAAKYETWKVQMETLKATLEQKKQEAQAAAGQNQGQGFASGSRSPASVKSGSNVYH